ncbi:hypothetical protein E2562_025315 [Oryza meyeriana var. granulata]|uniref:GATA-type domain-containing protein n=1 Tax=Oryza meyeriana var. granulata TaxID=110450 RepID=A0A6G1EPA5_9ORYZ|nr:hypothetical protein E2562_025315 [Oryza meyeriana var. granulata]
MGSSNRKVIGIAAAEEGRRCCVECRATTTPMWRGGPTGPRQVDFLLPSLGKTESCHLIAVSCDNQSSDNGKRKTEALGTVESKTRIIGR